MVLVALGCVSVAPAAPKTVTKAPPKITLLDAGAAPRQPLRLRLTEGHTQAVVITMAQNPKTTIDGEQMPDAAIPAVVETMELRVESVRLDGEATVSMRIVDAHADADAKDADPVMVAMLNDALAPMSKITGTITVTSRVVIRSMTFKAPDDLPPEMDQILNSFSQSMDQMSTPFPTEPVGVGASWSVVNDIEVFGLRMMSNTIIKLTAIDNNTVSLAMTGAIQRAPEAPNNPQTAPEGTTINRDSFSASFHGATVFDLHDFTARSGELTESVNVDTPGATAGNGTKNHTQVELKVTIKTPPPVAPETSVNKSK